MRGNGISRGMGIAVTAALVAVACLSKTAIAQGAPPCKDACWIDAKTGASVPTAPASGVNYGVGAGEGTAATFDPLNPNRASNPKTGQTFIKQADGSWIDAKNGLCVPTAPASG